MPPAEDEPEIEDGKATRLPAERARRRRRSPFALTKYAVVHLFDFLARRAPIPLVVLIARALEVVARLGYGVPGNGLRQACEELCAAAARFGVRHEPRAVYRRYAREGVEVVPILLRVYRDGQRAEVPLRFAEGVRERIEAARARNQGLIFAVPHATAGIVAAIALSRMFPLLIVARNPRAEARTAMARDFAAQAGVEVLFVRGLRGGELAASLRSRLREGTVVALTLDNLSRGPQAVTGTLLGGTARLSSFGSRFIAESGVPVMPVYVTIEGGIATLHGDEATVCGTPESATACYTGAFERAILANPGSWAYLADRRWRAVLRGGLASPAAA